MTFSNGGIGCSFKLHKRNSGQTEKTVCPVFSLLTDTQSCDDGTVSLDIYLDEVVEQRTALTDHLKKTAAGVVVLLMDLEVLGKVVDPLCQKSDLNLGRTCVALMSSVLLHDSNLFFLKHLLSPFLRYFAHRIVQGR